MLMHEKACVIPILDSCADPESFVIGGDDGPPLNAGLKALPFSLGPDQYCLETLYFCDFRCPDSLPPPPLDPRV